jgi:nicotinamide-nucleotide amidase
MSNSNVYAGVITIGDEILYGQITDTNSQWIGNELANIGVKLRRKLSVGDDKNEIRAALASVAAVCDIILITGGLGPTKDDITKNTLADYFGSSLAFQPEVFEHISRLFRARGKENLIELNRGQAYIPANGEVVHNAVGTAPGMWFYFEGKVFISMPGVPHEMKKMMTDIILPRLKKEFKTPFIYHKIVRTIGIAESKLANDIAEWEDALPKHIKLAYLPKLGQVRLRLTCIGDNLKELQAEADRQIEKLLPLIGEYIFGYDEEDIDQAIGKLLLKKGETVAVAESCTGGYVSHLFTSKSGSSAYFKGAVVAYSNEVKVNLLGVSPATLAKFGAVSEQTAKQMADGVRERLNSDYGISITGVAGPTGGTPEKPVGTVWIAYSSAKQTVAQLLTLTTDRTSNIQLSTNAVLNMLRLKIEEENQETN